MPKDLSKSQIIYLLNLHNFNIIDPFLLVTIIAIEVVYVKYLTFFFNVLSSTIKNNKILNRTPCGFSKK